MGTQSTVFKYAHHLIRSLSTEPESTEGAKICVVKLRQQTIKNSLCTLEALTGKIVAAVLSRSML